MSAAAGGIPILLVGAFGRMGREVAAVVRGEAGVRLAGAFEAPGHPGIGGMLRDAAGEVGAPPVESLERLAGAVGEGTVVVDFSGADGLAALLGVLAERPCPLVSGSTGFGDGVERELARLAERVPVVQAPNLSVGVAALRVLVRRLAGVLGEGFDVEIVEVHHGGKRDAPSGTALALASAVSEGRGFSGGPVVDRAVRGRPREVGGVGVSVVRGGGVVGDHTVHFLGREERIELTHRAADRRVFARGAVRAARWVVGRPPGRHGMEEVLGLGAPDRVRG